VEYAIEEADATDGVDNEGGVIMVMRRGRGTGREQRRPLKEPGERRGRSDDGDEERYER
jgi:hypothetical protein